MVAGAFWLAGCDRRPDVGPVVVSAIGAAPQLTDASRAPRDTTQRLVADSIAQGLVRFDAAGQIEPGIAERWIVTDEGRSYIFRLRDATWSDGRSVTAQDIATILRRQLAPGSHNPLAPYLTAIGAIVVMTPQVVQIDLTRPRPDLLKLFAQPELAIARANPPGGSGPFRVVRRSSKRWQLSPIPDADRAIDEQQPPAPEDRIDLIGERAARAVTRFMAKRSDMVAGGTFMDWPLLGIADAAPANIRLDPAAGLFGFAIATRTGFLADPEARAAVAQAIDREALTDAFAREWTSTEQILPDALDAADAPAVPQWAAATRDQRRAAAAARVASWRNETGAAPVIRIALPRGPGANLLWGRVGADLISIGALPRRVAVDAPADLRLIDEVAPYDSARWYLATACAPCGPAATAAIEAARVAATLEQRARALADADAALAADAAFIPLARPLRWSLVAARLRAWQPNARAWHPLNRLRRDTN